MRAMKNLVELLLSSEICYTGIDLFHGWIQHQPNFFFLFNQNPIIFFLLYQTKDQKIRKMKFLTTIEFSKTKRDGKIKIEKFKD